MHPTTTRNLLVSLAALVTLLAGVLLAPAPAGARPAETATQLGDSTGRRVSWAPADTAKIHPGVQMYTKGAQCTGNFVFTNDTGRVYVGYAAHCAGKGAATDTDGCTTGSLPLGTRVRFAEGGTLAGGGTTVGHGTLVYSSWLAMQQRPATDLDACAANDFALVRVDGDDERKVNPSVPFWGGPVGVADRVAAGDRVYSWGQSSLRPTTVLSPKTGVVLTGTNRGWGWDVYTASPGVPGDSGSGFLDPRGRAFGTLSTVAIAPVPGANGLGDLVSELRYARDHSGIGGLRLVQGTRPFQPVL